MNKANTFLITLYIPNGGKTTKQLAYHAKTEALSALRNNLKTKHLTRFHNIFAEAVEKEVNKLEDHQKGIAVLARFHPDKEPIDDDIDIQVLAHEPLQSHYVGKTFNISELLRTKELAKQTLVIRAQRDKADIYLLESGIFTPTSTVENQFALDKEASEYHEQYNLNAGNEQIHQGSGDKTLEKRIEQENLRFLNDLEEAIKNISVIDKTKLQYIIVLYSSHFNQHIERFTENICKYYGDITCKLIDKNITDDNEIEAISQQTLEDLINERKEELLEKAKENYHLYIEDYESVQQASLESRIDTLFVNSELSDQTLIKQVLQTGGDIVFVDSPEIAAKLRY